MIKKFKDKKGSAMQIAIVSIALVGIFTTSVTSMVINQTKSNIKSSQSSDLKYETEEGIEEIIAEFIDNIDLQGYKIDLTNFNMIQEYIELADILIGSNGAMNTTINSALEKIANGTIEHSDMEALLTSISEAINKYGNSNSSARVLLVIAQDYASFFERNFFDTTTGKLDTSNINKDLIKSLTLKIIDNLTNEVFVTGKGTLGSTYKEVTLNNTQYNIDRNLDEIYNIFFSSGTNITNKINSLESLSKLQIEDIIKKIDDTDYKEKIKLEIENIRRDGYIDVNSIKGKYTSNVSGVGKIDFKSEVEKRLLVAESEIDMLKKCLIYWLDYTNGTGNDSIESDYKLILNVPKTISILDDDTKIKNAEITKYYIDNINNISYIDDTYRFNIKNPGPKSELQLNLNAESEVRDENKGNYKIQSNVNIRIYKILSKDNYQVQYEVQDWNKVNIQ